MRRKIRKALTNWKYNRVYRLYHKKRLYPPEKIAKRVRLPLEDVVSFILLDMFIFQLMVCYFAYDMEELILNGGEEFE